MSRAFLNRARVGLPVLFILGITLVAMPLQAQVADAVLEVIVGDQTSQALPGVTVTVTRPETGFSRVATTTENGTARIPALSPGTYKVQLDLQGFASVVQDNLVLRVGQTARLDVKMKVATVQETVTVIAESEPLVDVYKLDSSTNIVPEQIQDLPIQNRDFQRLAYIAPGVQRERGGFRFIQNGPDISSGGNASLATILVDGVDLTDPSLGLSRVRFSQDAIGEFRVIQNRFDTEIGNSAGGALSIVTKSGTNDFRGSAFGFFRDSALRAQGSLETSEANYSRAQYGFTFGGPILKDRTQFFVSFEEINEDNVTPFRPGGIYAPLATDVPVPLDTSLVYGGINQKITDKQQLAAKFVYEYYRQENFRVGGVADVASGQELKRDNWNLTLNHTWNAASNKVNNASFQYGRRSYEEPTNVLGATAEYFSSGNTLITGTNIVGNLFGKSHQFELRDTFFLHKGKHDFKMGAAWLHITDQFFFPVFETGQLTYATDTRALPFLYVYGDGSGDATITTDIISAFVQDDFRPRPNLTLNLGVRYDIDTNGNNPDFTNPLVPVPRGRDTNNFQPRFGFSWDVTSNGQNVVRGGVGFFIGRFLLVPSFTELQQNGQTGRKILIRVAVLPFLPIDPNNPKNTGFGLPVSPTLLSSPFVNPQATQATLGYTRKLWNTGLYFDLEGIYVKGTSEVIIRDTNFSGNAAVAAGQPARINPAYGQINTYSNEGHAEYKALVASVNGTIAGKHMVAASFTWASKQNINDDFSPALTDYPSDPSDIEAEYGRSRADERCRFVLSAIFKLPWTFTVSPIFEYGTGQPWNSRYGYDYNGDGRASDRPSGVPRFSADGPRFTQVSLRITKGFKVGKTVGIDVIAEAFNLFNTVNYDVNSIQTGQFLSGPTLANPRLPANPNPRYGQATATLQPFEGQLGIRIVF